VRARPPSTKGCPPQNLERDERVAVTERASAPGR
jgi:hypothetical protein